MNWYRVRAVDLRTKRPINYEAFEAIDEADVTARLNRAGMVAEAIAQVVPGASPPQAPDGHLDRKIMVTGITSRAQWHLALALLKAWFLILLASLVVLFSMSLFLGGVGALLRAFR